MSTNHSDADATRRAAYRSIRSIFETPIMDDYKWAKIPDIPADMIFLDLEDSVPPASKEPARERAVGYLRDPSFFGGRPTLARPNHLSTVWGREDVIALAEAGVGCMAYPKLESYEELLEIIELLAEHGATPDIYAIVEASGAMMDIKEISRHPQVVSLMFGPGDMSVEMGIPLLEPNGDLNPVFQPMKSQAVVAAAAAHIGVSDIVYAPDYRDYAEVRRRGVESRRQGFTALSTFYPPHVAIIHEIFTPSAEEIEAAQELIELYEEVLAQGRPAALTASGETVLVHDYEKARSLVARAR
ncbi:citrate lyase subunit beta/citryl-CoA lyase [Jatrophihabitans sp. GAS493]|uniref:HpcH/HpaI aldolase/citrate lyase family protein n=1 Tax=Jatrophihabitans sp. GAS493 TaxID=1907575 RepID=UPI000BB705F9|nr:aldolase/citrate lyase family protein [Jatrophihabitans sp. GAS493]SOD71781.1 citrate lyase subunit beta/citryl-CoA lyase [Jatrophihabitans sp. GAS493]